VTLRGRQVHLCARCSGIYPGILAGLLFPVHPTPFWLIALLPFPALVDWAITSFRTYHDYNAVRTATGLLLGYGYGVGLTQLFGHGNIAIIPIGLGYGVIAIAFLYLERTTEK